MFVLFLELLTVNHLKIGFVLCYRGTAAYCMQVSKGQGRLDYSYLKPILYN